MRRLVALLIAAGLTTACGDKPCDAGKLEQVAEAVQDRSPKARAAALEALDGACPTMPVGLMRSLVAGFSAAPADQRSQIYASRFDDAQYVALRELVCPCTPKQWREAVSSAERGAAVFEVCGLDRYGLLEPGEPFLLEDLDAFVLYEWLTSKRVGAALAKRVVRGLVAAGASDAELMAICRERQSGCGPAFERISMQLATSTSASRIGDGIELRVWADAVALGERRVLGLRAGAVVPGSLTRHVSPELRDALLGAAAEARERAQEQMIGWDPQLVLVADRATPFGTVADLLFTGVKSGFQAFQLAIMSDGELGAIDVSVPRRWLRPGGDHFWGREGPRLELFVHADAVELEMSRQRQRFAAIDWTALDPGLGQALTALHQAHPDAPIVSFYVDRNVPLQALVTLIDLARGEGCRIWDDYDEIHESCQFYIPIIDTIPSLHWNVGRSIELGDAQAKRVNPRKRGGPSTTSILTTYAAKREAIAGCLVGGADDPSFMAGLVDGAQVSVMWGLSQEDGKTLVLRVWTGYDDDPFATGEVEWCVARVFGVAAGPREKVGVFLQEQRAELTFPVRIVD